MPPPTISIPGGRSKPSRHAQRDLVCQRSRRPSPQLRRGRSGSSPFGAIQRNRGRVDVPLRMTLLQHDQGPKVAGKEGSLCRRTLSVLRRCRKKRPKWRCWLHRNLRLDHGAPVLQSFNPVSLLLGTTRARPTVRRNRQVTLRLRPDPPR